MCERFRDRVAIVTGAAQGIGRVLAERLHEESATLALVDLDPKVTDTAREIANSREGGAPVEGWVADLSDEPAVEAAVQSIEKRFGKIDVLVNNAGGGVILPFFEHTPETLKKTIDRNLMTTYYCCRHVIAGMRARGYGRIVNIGAESVRNGLWRHAVYNAAKGGVHGLTTGLAREMAPYGITVNTVAPSGTLTRELEVLTSQDTPVGRDWKGFLDDITKMIPMGRLATCEEIAAAVAFIGSEEASFVTGQVLSVNGGSSMS